MYHMGLGCSVYMSVIQAKPPTEMVAAAHSHYKDIYQQDLQTHQSAITLNSNNLNNCKLLYDDQ